MAENVSDKMAPATMKGRQRWRSNRGGGVRVIRPVNRVVGIGL